MPLYFHPFRVRVKQFDRPTNALTPLPLESGFREGVAYDVLGLIEHSPDGELWVVVANQDGEIWRFSQRHWRVATELDERPANVDPKLWERMQEPE